MRVPGNVLWSSKRSSLDIIHTQIFMRFLSLSLVRIIEKVERRCSAPQKSRVPIHHPSPNRFARFAIHRNQQQRSERTKNAKKIEKKKIICAMSEWHEKFRKTKKRFFFHSRDLSTAIMCTFSTTLLRIFSSAICKMEFFAFLFHNSLLLLYSMLAINIL